MIEIVYFYPDQSLAPSDTLLARGMIKEAARKVFEGKPGFSEKSIVERFAPDEVEADARLLVHMNVRVGSPGVAQNMFDVYRARLEKELGELANMPGVEWLPGSEGGDIVIEVRKIETGRVVAI